jgi:hypothetical protein
MLAKVIVGGALPSTRRHRPALVPPSYSVPGRPPPPVVPTFDWLAVKGSNSVSNATQPAPSSGLGFSHSFSPPASVNMCMLLLRISQDPANSFVLLEQIVTKRSTFLKTVESMLRLAHRNHAMRSLRTEQKVPLLERTGKTVQRHMATARPVSPRG